MLRIIFLGLIAKLALVCNGCDVGKWGVENFDWNQVGIVAQRKFLETSDFISGACVYISIVIPLSNSKHSIADSVLPTK
jgi:hypothetical protein